MPETHLDKFKKLLAELFMFDQADLDFGIYRIMNAKRDEITKFLDRDLLPQVREALGKLEQDERSIVEAELTKAIEQAKALGADAESLPKVKELRQQLAQKADVEALESEVFSDLYSFFRRYYSEGDFLSLRRYKKGVYAIPYEGEEVKLHWANADQYYIKTTEYFRDYIFKLADGRRVHFKLIEANTEQNNNKSTAGQERRFILREREPVADEKGELVIRFEYRPDLEKRKQADLNTQAIQRILAAEAAQNWLAELIAKASTNKNPERTILEKRLADYTALNTFDYFIHKDLGGFLQRELDFYIKNEVMHLDDIESDSAAGVQQYLAKIRAIRSIAYKIIAFVAQLEEFQKKLWLKKKFVVETNYCVSLDRVREELYAEIAANDAQREEWVRLFAIDEIAGDLAAPRYTNPLTVEFLKANDNLLIDTRFFDSTFVSRLLATIEDLDARVDGLLIHSDNFHALNLIQARYREQVKCIYIDPPYNTDSSAIPYKNDYRHSSWAALMFDRISIAHRLMSDGGAIFVSIDKHERSILQFVLDDIFGQQNLVEELIWVQNTNDGRSPTYSTNHEYVEVYANSKSVVENDRRMFREPKPGYFEVMALIDEINPEYPPIGEIESALARTYEQHKREYRDSVEAQDLDWETEKRNDPWKGLYPYKFAEYRDEQGNYIPAESAERQKAKIWVFRESDWTIMSSEVKQSATIYDAKHPNHRFYQPQHHLTGKPCAMPSRGWKGTQFVDPKHPERNSFESLMKDNRIVFGDDETKVPQQKRMLHEVQTNVSKSVFVDYSDGEKETAALFGKTGVFLAPKHTNFVSRFVLQSACEDGIVLDFFGGSGSTVNAVINVNREDSGNRKYILAEVANYFDTVLKPRALKAAYSREWKNGKPVARNGVSQCIKVIRLESYEETLNNLDVNRTRQQGLLLDLHPEMREDYVLRYMLDVESKDSASLLDLDQFEDPFNYKLKVSTGSAGETRLANVDLVETFNWLLGLRVKHIDVIRGFRVVHGTNQAGEKVLVLWRNTREKSNADLDEFFLKQDYNTRDMEFDLIYVNGDNNLENLKRPDETWKVRLIEEEFKALMFDVEDV